MSVAGLRNNDIGEDTISEDMVSEHGPQDGKAYRAGAALARDTIEQVFGLDLDSPYSIIEGVLKSYLTCRQLSETIELASRRMQSAVGPFTPSTSLHRHRLLNALPITVKRATACSAYSGM